MAPKFHVGWFPRPRERGMSLDYFFMHVHVLSSFDEIIVYYILYKLSNWLLFLLYERGNWCLQSNLLICTLVSLEVSAPTK